MNEPENGREKDVPQRSAVAPPIWSERFRIKSYDVDFRRRASLESLCRYFLEAAWNHAEALGAGFAELASRNRLWVLSRLLVEVKEYPRWTEPVHLRTWARPAQSLFAMRDFEFQDSSGRPFAGGSSAWLVLDEKRRRPQRLDELLLKVGTAQAHGASRDPQKLNRDPGPDSLIPARGHPEAEINFQARYSDEDLNGHVNSVRYVRWLLDAYPLEWHKEYLADAVELNFLGECKTGDRLKLVTKSRSPGQFCHEIFKIEGQEVLRGMLSWGATREAG
jgi:medium-chain acyl-[acyl-carrier-protein] hydrolase